MSANQQKSPPQKKSSTTKSTKKSEKSEQTASDECDQDVHENKNAKQVRQKHLLVISNNLENLTHNSNKFKLFELVVLVC